MTHDFHSDDFLSVPRCVQIRAWGWSAAKAHAKAACARPIPASFRLFAPLLNADVCKLMMLMMSIKKIETFRMGRISFFKGVIWGRDWYKGRQEQLLPEPGSSIRQQFRDVRRTGGRLGGTFDGWLDAQRAGQRPDTWPLGSRDSPTNAGVGAQTSGRSGAAESRSKSAGVSGLWAPANAVNPGLGTDLSDPLRADDDPAAAGLVSAEPAARAARDCPAGKLRGCAFSADTLIVNNLAMAWSMQLKEWASRVKILARNIRELF
jgi:hypothetical protein